MAYQVVLRPSADKEVNRLPKEVRLRVVTKIQQLAENPRPLGVKKLQGKISLYRVPVGSYRIVYVVNDPAKLVTVTIVADRKEVYRGL